MDENNNVTNDEVKAEKVSNVENNEVKTDVVNIDASVLTNEEIKNISLLKDQAIQIGKKEGFDYSVEQSKGWGWIAKIGAKYKYYTDGFKKKLEEKDEEIGVVKNQRNEQQKKHRAFKKEY